MSKNKYPSGRRRKNKDRRASLPAPAWLVLGGFILVGVALFAVWKSSQPTKTEVPMEVAGSPSLKVDQEKIDLGDVPVNKTVSVSFELANVGDEPLRFSSNPYIEVVEGC